MTTTRNTIVFTGALFDAARTARSGSTLVARPVTGQWGLTLLAHRLGNDPTDGELIVMLGPDGLELEGIDVHRVVGRLPGTDGSSVTADAVRVVDHRWRVLLATRADSTPPVFDRQIRAFGAAGQQLLACLRVGVVGAGGTGSAVCEQLVRLGIGEIIVVDDDVINDDGSNVTRVWGSTMADIGKAKVDIVARTAARIGFPTRVTPIKGTINDEAPAYMLRQCDVIFGCTDDNRGRLTLSRLALWYLIPIIDMGVKLTSNNGTLRTIEGRITIVQHDNGCLQCRGRINAQALQAEVLEPAERLARIAEGYAVGLDERDPAVITYTTGVAALAVSEFLARIFSLDTQPGSTELIVRFHERDIRRNSRAGKPGHWCTDPANVGAGDAEPFLGTVWTS